MKLGVFTTVFSQMQLEPALRRARELGFEAVEFGTGAYPGKPHVPVETLLEDRQAIEAFKRTVADHGMMISALSVHGNPLHPNKEIARAHHEDFRKTVLLAERMEVPVINAFPGCPGDSEGSKLPNWVTCSWPPDFLQILDWQWNQVAIPYWKDNAAFATQHGVKKIGFEPHPGMLIYNTETALRMRREVGECIGVNLDPSHLMWQGMDIETVIDRLGREGAIFHVHAKDAYIDKNNTAVNGCLDVKPYSQLADRSWTFRSVGWGNGVETWRKIVSKLRMHQYDYVLSVEHEDPLASIDEGLKTAVATLRQAILKEPPCEMWWA